MKNFCSLKTLLGDEKQQTGTKYLQIMYLTKFFHPDYIKNSQTVQLKIVKNKQ